MGSSHLTRSAPRQKNGKQHITHQTIPQGSLLRTWAFYYTKRCTRSTFKLQRIIVYNLLMTSTGSKASKGGHKSQVLTGLFLLLVHFCVPELCQVVPKHTRQPAAGGPGQSWVESKQIHLHTDQILFLLWNLIRDK